MKNNQLLHFRQAIVRVLDSNENELLFIDCINKKMPKWKSRVEFSEYIPCDDVFSILPDINDLDPQSRKIAYERYTLIAGVLPYIADKKQRCAAIARVAEYNSISKQTIYNYLWIYLVHQSVSALAPKTVLSEKKLSQEEKNFRWALNKYFYTQKNNTLNTAYTLMLKDKYCDANGTLIQPYPSFYQFRYYYRKHILMHCKIIAAIKP